MKRIGFLLILALLLGTCTKEPERKPVISGRVVDIVTQKGIAGIEVNVVDFWTDGWNYEIPITGTAITDSEGDFVVNYTVKEKNDARLMQLCYLPDGYQRGARINGKIETCVFFDLLFDYGDLSGDYKVEDEGSYQVELMPANTFAYLVRPAVPAAWLADTIEIGGVILRVKYCSCKRRDVGITRAFRHFLKRIVFFLRTDKRAAARCCSSAPHDLFHHFPFQPSYVCPLLPPFDRPPKNR
jgi:hypothetical protein